MKLRNTLMTKTCDVANVEKVPIINNLLGREGLHFIETITIEEKETCKSNAWLFQMLNEKFNLQDSETSLSLQ